MIKEIKIENFKSIESLNLDLGRLNVFIGANGSGKSNILEGIAFGSVALADRLDNGYIENKGARLDRIFLKSAFEVNNKKDILIQFQNSTDFIAVRVSPPNKELLSPWIAKTQKSSSKDVTANDVGVNYVKSLGDDRQTIEEVIAESYNRQSIEKLIDDFHIRHYIIFAPENSILRNFREEGQILPMGFRGEGLFSHLVELSKKNPNILKKLNENLHLLDWFDGFEIPNDLIFTERRIKIKDRYLEEGLQYIDQRSANEGFLYLLFYLTLFISDETPKFFAIDNIDNAMNPKLGRELIKILAKLAKEHDKQTILTTHNPSVLDGLDLKDDDQRLFVIYRNADGHTKARRITSKEVPNGVESVRLSEAFIRGYIGGLPKNF